MGHASRLLQKRKRALEKLAELMDNPDHVLVIHYSCESFYDRDDGTSPRITSIAVRNLSSGLTRSFSIHQFAEVEGALGNGIEDSYNDLERMTLDGFYEFVRAHEGYTWMHWNMRDSNYGFQAIAHRYRVLDGQPVDIPDSYLFDLARAMVSIYGRRYIGHPRMKNIVEKNRVSHKDFLSGAEEASAFERGDYYALHQSTLRKVDIIANLAERADQGVLETDYRFSQQWRLLPMLVGEWLKEHWFASLLMAILAIVGLVLTVIQLFT